MSAEQNQEDIELKEDCKKNNRKKLEKLINPGRLGLNIFQPEGKIDYEQDIESHL